MVDLIFFNGTVVTMDPAQPVAAAVAVKGGKIVKAGTEDAILAFRQPETDVVDLKGAALLPGFIEAHGHPLFSALTWGDPVIDIRAVHTATYEAALRAVRELRDWLSKYSTAGYTTTAEMGMVPEWAGYFDALRKQETLPIRIRIYEQGELDKPYISTLGSGDDHFKTIGIKFWADGALFLGTAAVSRPYLNTDLTIKKLGLPPDNVGRPTYSRDEQERLMTAAISQGWQLAVHALGDVAIDTTLDLFEKIFKSYPNANGPCRLEHCMVMKPDQVQRAHDSAWSVVSSILLPIFGAILYARTC